MYLRGVGTARSAEKAALLNKRLCESGRRYFCPTYAFVLFLGRGVPKDGARARQLFAENCQHDPKACSEYGSLIAVGTGVPQDLEFGVFLLDLACRERNAMACRDLQRLRAQGLYPKDGASPPAEQ
ncbi:MAG: sel1 repeat family protein [Polyangiaceae bacterium]|nr:sel1 repeat family protein [Polyangiaceae bacterium]